MQGKLTACGLPHIIWTGIGSVSAFDCSVGVVHSIMLYISGCVAAAFEDGVPDIIIPSIKAADIGAKILFIILNISLPSIPSKFNIFLFKGNKIRQRTYYVSDHIPRDSNPNF